MYINSNEIKNKLKEKQIYIFGTGIDAQSLLSDLNNEVGIVAFVDNRRHGAKFNEREVISNEQLNDRCDSNSVVVIASYRFAHEILKGLDNTLWRPGNNCFIWDEDRIFLLDDSTRRLVNLNNEIWSNRRRTNASSIVLVPYDNVHSATPFVYAYFANCLAEKYDAKICGISSRGGEVINESEVIKDIFRSFNVSGFIRPQIDDAKGEKLVKELVEDIWKDIYTWEDWKNISVLGLQIGTSIIRYINRFYIFDFEPRTDNNKELLTECIRIIVAVEEVFDNNLVSAVILRDGVCWENFIRESAFKRNIPAYAIQHEGYYRRAKHDFCTVPYVKYYKNFWKCLTEEEKAFGLKEAERRLNDRIKGSTEDIPYMVNNTVFSGKMIERQIKESDRIKILICPHIFEEDSYVCGEHIFDNNYIEWLNHLGELSQLTDNYDWYIKMHPNSEYRDRIIIERLVSKYSRISIIKTETSPVQLKKEGIDFALTVYGSMAHEYAMLGIRVINAGVNPHCAFSFSLTPSSKEEFDKILMNLEDVDFIIDKNDIYRFYAVHYIYYRSENIEFTKKLFKNPLLYSSEAMLEAKGLRRGTWMYDLYVKSFKKEDHMRIYEETKKEITRMDEWDEKVFYKKEF